MERKMVPYKLKEYIIDVMKKHNGETRRFDKKTPYFIHPLWCAMTILSETNLPIKFKEKGALILLYHDVLESNQKLPEFLPKKVKYYVELMTYKHFSDEAKDKSNQLKEIKLFRLYDKVSNLLDSNWMTIEKKKQYLKYTKYLLKDVKRNYPNLNIVKICKGVIKNG